MKPASRVWLVLGAVAAVCVLSVLYVYRLRDRSGRDTGSLLRRLPLDNTIVLHVDFAALRAAGILELLNPEAAPEQDYLEFVRSSGFDYQQHLDRSLVAFTGPETYLILQGRFDWSRLNEHVVNEGGSCYNTYCRLRGSRPDRLISFFPLNPRVMAMAVSRDWGAADSLKQERFAQVPFQAPAWPVWLRVPPDRLRGAQGSLPAPAQRFARAIETAEEILIGAAADGLQMRAELAVRCSSRDDAGRLAAELRQATIVLSQGVRSQSPGAEPDSLAALLAAGTFSENERVVRGQWPVDRAFLQSLAAAP